MHEAVKWGEKLGVMEELFFRGECLWESILWRIGKIHFSERRRRRNWTKMSCSSESGSEILERKRATSGQRLEFFGSSFSFSTLGRIAAGCRLTHLSPPQNTIFHLWLTYIECLSFAHSSSSFIFLRLLLSPSGLMMLNRFAKLKSQQINGHIGSSLAPGLVVVVCNCCWFVSLVNFLTVAPFLTPPSRGQTDLAKMGNYRRCHF